MLKMPSIRATTALPAAKSSAVVYAANFSPGVNLVLALAEQMGAALPAEQYDAEILEMHHRQKVDAPSGARRTAGRGARAPGNGGLLPLAEYRLCRIHRAGKAFGPAASIE